MESVRTSVVIEAAAAEAVAAAVHLHRSMEVAVEPVLVPLEQTKTSVKSSSPANLVVDLLQRVLQQANLSLITTLQKQIPIAKLVKVMSPWNETEEGEVNHH